MYALRAGGASPRRIAEILTEEGTPWKDGTPWTEARAYQALRAPVYIGYRYDSWNDQWTRGAWEPIVSAEDYARINERSPPTHADGPQRTRTREKCRSAPRDPKHAQGPPTGRDGPEALAVVAELLGSRPPFNPP